jgi:hypothetical protein
LRLVLHAPLLRETGPERISEESNDSCSPGFSKLWLTVGLVAAVRVLLRMPTFAGMLQRT